MSHSPFSSCSMWAGGAMSIGPRSKAVSGATGLCELQSLQNRVHSMKIKKQVSPETIEADLAIIAKRFHCVRTYMTLYGMDAVPK